MNSSLGGVRKSPKAGRNLEDVQLRKNHCGMNCDPRPPQIHTVQWYSPGPQDDVILFGESFRVVIKVK